MGDTKSTYKRIFNVTLFTHCSLTWMFHSGNMEHHINKIGKRALKVVYNDTTNLIFDELLLKDKSVSIHQINFQLPAIEIFKVKNQIATELMNEIFQFAKKP